MTGPRYSITPADATFDRRLEAQDLRVLLLLGCHTNKMGWCSRSQVKMARELACSRSTIQRALGRLIECGYVEQRSLQRDDGGDRAHEYRVLLDEVRPAQFINDVDGSTEAAADGADAPEDDETPCPPTGTPAHPRAPLPTHGQGVPLYRAPIITSPLERSERETRAPGARKASDEEIVAAAYADPAFMAVIGDWPTAASDGPLTTYPAWCALSDDERAEAARFAPTAIAQHAANGRKGAYSLRRYLVEKRWKLLPAAAGGTGPVAERLAADAPPVSIPARSKPWFAVFWRRWKAGEKVRMMFDMGLRGLPYGVRPGDMPSEAELAGLVQIQTAENGRPTVEMAAWRDALAKDGISFTPIDLHLPFVFVPSRWPPGA